MTHRSLALAFLTALTATVACSDDADPVTPEGEGASAPAVDPEVQALYDCEEPDFAVFTPLSGPGFDAEQGGLLGPPQASYIVHTTHLIVKEGEDAAVLAHSGQIIAQLAETPGLVGFSLAGSDACRNVRTIGIWESEEAMYGFVNTGAHAAAMADTLNISDSGKVVHWEASPEDVDALTWDVAKARIAEELPSGLYDE